MKTTYLLFGGEASAIMDSTGNIHDAVRVGCTTYKFTEGGDIVDLLSEYTGWDNFWVLTEEEFNQINQLIEQR